MKSHKQALIGLNLGVFIMTLAPICAKLIPWPSLMIIWGRMALAAPCMLAFLLLTGKRVRFASRKDAPLMLFLSALLAVHWVTYFASTKISTVAIGMLSVFTYPIFITFIEPYFAKTRVKREDVWISLIAFAGVIFMIENLSWKSTATQGIALGTFSALAYAFRNILSKRLMPAYSGSQLMFYQLLFGSLMLSPIAYFMPVTVEATDLWYLLLLAVLATALAHTLFLSSMSILSARTAAILAVIQPLYGVVLAITMLGEYPTARELIGGTFILSAVVIETLRHTKKGAAAAEA